MKKAIIIGATSGIGKALAEVMVEDGWQLGITGRRAGLLEEIAARNPEVIELAAFDLTADNATSKLEEMIAAMGEIDLLVLSSGTGDLDSDLDPAITRRTNTLNVDAFSEVVLFAYKYFAGKGGGHIAAITSVAGLRGGDDSPSYGASKAYQINFLEALRKRSLKLKENVSVTDLRPGSVDTDMMKGDGHFWISTPEKAARTMYKGISKRKSVQYVTPRWRFIGGLLNIMPRKLYNRI